MDEVGALAEVLEEPPVVLVSRVGQGVHLESAVSALWELPLVVLVVLASPKIPLAVLRVAQRVPVAPTVSLALPVPREVTLAALGGVVALNAGGRAEVRPAKPGGLRRALAAEVPRGAGRWSRCF